MIFEFFVHEAAVTVVLLPIDPVLCDKCTRLHPIMCISLYA